MDAAHRVHHQPGLYFALVLVLEAGLFGSFTALNFFHWFLFWELSLIPAFFLIKLWGGAQRGPAATQFFVYTMAGSRGAAGGVSGGVSFHRQHGFSAPGAAGLDRRRWSRWSLAHLGPVMLWLAIGVLAGFAVKVPMVPFHTWLPAAYAEAPSPVTMLLTGAMSKMGVYGLLRIALPLFGAADRADADAAAGAGGGDGGDGRVGRGGAEGFEARLRLLVGEPPGLLPAGHLCAGGSGGGMRRRRPARPRR